MKNEGFDVMDHMEETGQISKPEVMKVPESTEGNILEHIDSVIDDVLKKSRIQLNTGDTRIVQSYAKI